MNRCVVGLQWGDEGKGKVVDILAAESDVVVRYGGGANAGHTVVVGDKSFALHLLPSGSIRPGVVCVIAGGVVVDPQTLIDGINRLREHGIGLEGRLLVSENAHVVLDYHKAEDRLREQLLGKNKLGTTARGIGPCYCDKVARTHAVRMSEFRDLKALEAKIGRIVDYKNKVFAAVYGAEPMDAGAIFEKCAAFAEVMLPFTADTTKYLHESIAGGKSVLFEGAQGTLLDLDHGTFPFVTSSNSSALGLAAGCGVPAEAVDMFLGVAKAYTTRVGAGPFPTEQDNEIGRYIREKGHEYGTTTGRPRRCGWFDGVAAAYSVKIGGVDEVALMHLDTLTGMDELSICTAYRYADEDPSSQSTFFSANCDRLAGVECVYETVEGWKRDITAVRSFEDLPEAARGYVMRIEELVGRPVTYIGVGPKRDQIIYRQAGGT
jgi:adenylosuccinate synthase